MRANPTRPIGVLFVLLLIGPFVLAGFPDRSNAQKAGKRKRLKLTGQGKDVRAGTDDDAPPRRRYRRRKRRRRHRRRARRPRTPRTRWIRPAPVWKERHRQGRLGDIRYYSGVVPGKNNPPPDGLPTKSDPCYLTWPGFQLSPSGSRVFFQFTTRPAAVMTQSGRTVTITFPACRTRLRNNRRRLVTRYFKTPVTSVRIRARRKALQITLTLRKNTRPSESWTKSGRFRFYFLEFGKYKGPMPRDRIRRTKSRAKVSSSGGYIRVRREKTR